jgi:aryl-alcohol dehydrogenase-like predicted oxidoreductase
VDPLAPVPLREQVLEGVRQSLVRLRVRQVTLLQLHNGVTDRNGDEPASLSAEAILEPGGVAEALTIAREKGLARFIGLTGTGSPEALRRVVLSGRFDTIQVPYNRLNPSAGRVMEKDFSEMNYGNILADCQGLEMGAFAIRVLAGGALLGLPPSPHTRKTPYFPIELYKRDAANARSLGPAEDTGVRVRKALEFAWSHPAIHSAILGFADPHQVETAALD